MSKFIITLWGGDTEKVIWVRRKSKRRVTLGRMERTGLSEEVTLLRDLSEACWSGEESSGFVAVVQLLSHVQLFVTLWSAACQASLSISRSVLKLMSIVAVMPSHPLLSPSPPAIQLSQPQGLFQWVSSSDQVAKVLEVLEVFSFSSSLGSSKDSWDGDVVSVCCIILF